MREEEKSFSFHRRGELEVFVPLAAHSSRFHSHSACAPHAKGAMFFDGTSFRRKNYLMTRFPFIPPALIVLTGCLSFSSFARAAETKYPKTWEQYEIVRAALVADDLA